MAVINDIVRSYTLNVPVLDRANIGEYEPAAIKLEVPQNSHYGFFAGPGPYFIDATEFKIRIPFTGDKNLFRNSTTGYGNPVDGEVTDDAVILTHAAKNPDIEAYQPGIRRTIEPHRNDVAVFQGFGKRLE